MESCPIPAACLARSQGGLSPAAERTAASRYAEPTFFADMPTRLEGAGITARSLPYGLGTSVAAARSDASRLTAGQLIQRQLGALLAHVCRQSFR
jgi:hypothetical protein